MRIPTGSVRQSLLLSLVGGLAPLSLAVSLPQTLMLAPPVWVFLLPASVVGGTTTAHTHHAAHTKTAPFPVTYSYSVAVHRPTSLAYTVEIYPLALHAQRAAAGSTGSSLAPLRLAHPVIRGEWLRGVVTAHYCALVVGAVYRNLLLSANTAHTYAGKRVSHACRQDITTVLALERHLVGRAHGYALRH